ncbi:MAG: cytochrome ubiquinol oxidase subunit I [Anaerolineae bacterium]|nr:cytochrome ubiquinol oxidase subunit I [Anaerolineae bacterium]
MKETVNYQELMRVWRNPTGLASLTLVNHKAVGLRYIVTAFVFFGFGGLLALTMLLQLSRPGLSILSPYTYNQFFTMHGTTQMFLFAVPVMEGLGIYLVPLMIGARDAAFPRLNAFGYWVYLIAGVTLYASLLLGRAPDAGWFNYVPLSGPEYSPNVNIDFYTAAISFLEIAALVAAVELIVTIFKLRAPGMSINRMPLFVWAILVMSFMIVFAFPPLVLGSIMLQLDRMVGTHFFNVAAGGNPLLWQHLFWWFGHPEVYIIAIPAFGMISMVIPVFARRHIIGYLPVALSLLTIGLVSFGLWVHHMFTTSVSFLGMSLFAAASMAIAIPSGVQVFAWVGTIYESRRLLWRTPLLFSSGFVVLFVLGGITGVMVASVPFDWQVQDSHFVTAHFHYVLIGGAVFPLFAGLYYWYPKLTGRLLDERLGRLSFWLMFVGFNVAFFTMHYTGFMGMPRRVSTYMFGRGWDTPMLITAVGAFVLAAGIAVTLVAAISAHTRPADAPADPWGGGTLEWATASPPPPYNFEMIPAVNHRTPLWPATGQVGPADTYYHPRDDQRETIGTSILDAEPQQRVLLAGNSVWPVLLALAVAITFIGSIVTLVAVPIGAFLSFIAIAGWNWPREVGA